jgi:hypothetical protein
VRLLAILSICVILLPEDITYRLNKHSFKLEKCPKTIVLNAMRKERRVALRTKPTNQRLLCASIVSMRMDFMANSVVPHLYPTPKVRKLMSCLFHRRSLLVMRRLFACFGATCCDLFMCSLCALRFWRSFCDAARGDVRSSLLFLYWCFVLLVVSSYFSLL